MLHPVHIHGCQFRIVKLDGSEPPAHMSGWKDTVPIENAGHAEIYVRFPLSASDDAPYMAHCHILEHEDSGMMTEFSVGCGSLSAIRSGSPSPTSGRHVRCG